jgi:broad specificity phosphatase PhoE
VSENRDINALFGSDHQQVQMLPPTVYFCRHGETASNARGRLRGHSNPELNATGRQQAEALAMTLQPTRPLAILASPLRRTLHTAEAIAAACGLSVEVTDDLLDRDYGRHNGHRIDEINAIWGSVDNAPGVEPWKSVLARARSALAKATTQAIDGPVVLVSHDAINSALLAFLDPKRWPDPRAVPQPPGCLNLLERVGDTWTVVTAGRLPSAPESSRRYDGIKKNNAK